MGAVRLKDDGSIDRVDSPIDPGVYDHGPLNHTQPVPDPNTAPSGRDFDGGTLNSIGGGGTGPSIDNGSVGRQANDNPGAPAFGQPSLAGSDITAAYQKAFGRAPTAAELASEQENANKYSATGILNSIAARSNNVAGSGQQGTATAASLGISVPGYTTAGGVKVPGSGAPVFSLPPAGGANTFRPANVPNQPNTSPQFTDPSQQLLESYALNRFQQLQNPDPNSGSALYEQYAKQLVDILKSPAFSAGDETTIIAGAMDHISTEEATTQQQWIEEMGRRNIPLSSGVALQGLQHIKEQFNQLRSSVHQQFATQAITQTQANRDKALGVLGNLATSENTRLNAAENYARIPYNLGTDAFNQGMQLVNAGGSPTQNVQSAIALMTAIQNSNTISSQQKATALQELMAFIGGL